MNHSDLRKLAELATPGEWETLREPQNNYIIKTNRSGIVTHYICEGVLDNDLPYIAAANPQRVIELLDEVEGLKYVPGQFKCAKCACVLYVNTIHAKTGSVGANNSPQQCPNKCGPMWKISYKDDLAEILTRSSDSFSQLSILKQQLAVAVGALNSIREKIANKDVSFAAYRIIDSVVNETNEKIKSLERKEGGK